MVLFWLFRLNCVILHPPAAPIRPYLHWYGLFFVCLNLGLERANMSLLFEESVGKSVRKELEREKFDIFGQTAWNLYRYYLSKYCFKRLIWFRLKFRYSIELILITIVNFSYNWSYNYFFFMYYFYFLSCMFCSHVGSMQSCDCHFIFYCIYF